MAWKPQPAGPRNLREFFHWCWKQLTDVGNNIGDEGETLSQYRLLDLVSPHHYHPTTGTSTTTTTC